MTEVADEFGTPTYVVDEADFRHRIRRYRAALPQARLVYSAKALLTTAVAQWIADERKGLGVCSRGELATALIAGVDPNQIVVHGMATTPGELCNAANARAGRIRRPAPGGGQHHSRRSSDGRTPGTSPGCRQGLHHREHRRGQASDGVVCRAHRQGDAGTWWQIRSDHCRRRSRGKRCAVAHPGQYRFFWSGLRRTDSGPGL